MGYSDRRDSFLFEEQGTVGAVDETEVEFVVILKGPSLDLMFCIHILVIKAVTGFAISSSDLLPESAADMRKTLHADIS